MKRPAAFAYWLDEVPPPGVVFLSALQHVGLICSLIAIPLAVAREAGLAPDQTVNLVAVSMLVLGITTILQTLQRGPVGSGLLAPSSFSGAYLAPSLIAAKVGGLPLVFGMTILGGLFEAALSRGFVIFVRSCRPRSPASWWSWWEWGWVVSECVMCSGSACPSPQAIANSGWRCSRWASWSG